MECIADDEQTNFERALSAQLAVHIGTLSRRMVESCIHAFDYIIQCLTFNSQLGSSTKEIYAIFTMTAFPISRDGYLEGT